jgi:hypothetical protein
VGACDGTGDGIASTVCATPEGGSAVGHVGWDPDAADVGLVASPGDDAAAPSATHGTDALADAGTLAVPDTAACSASWTSLAESKRSTGRF